jgi:hypothetical protein
MYTSSRSLVALLAAILAAIGHFPAISQETGEALVITIQHVSTGKPYAIVPAKIGAKIYLDRGFEIQELSGPLTGGQLLQTANEDDFATAGEHVRLKISRPAAIYVCYDARSHKAPGWLDGWKLTEEKVSSSDTKSRVYRRAFPAGIVTLGANERQATNGMSCYFAVIIPADAADNVPARPKIEVSFAKDIRPLLAARCNDCHGVELSEGGLRLDIRRLALLGGDTGLAIHPGSPEASEIIRRVTLADEKHRMPLEDEPLADREIQLLRAWIEQGADWPDEFAGKEDYSNHWSFRPVKRPDVPAVKAANRVANPIDSFILAKLEAEGLTLSPEADARTLIRRLYLDLTGLPPTPKEIADFELRIADLKKKDPEPKDSAIRIPQSAIEELVDRLLASPAFGERWGRHWLDLARYAESDGYENDRLRPDAWRFRDWVISSFNRDQPFDEFTIEQLAGDLLDNPTPAQRAATGFHRNTLWNSAASADKEEFRTRAVKDRAEVTATAWLGLTLACAQCHSHKYDPIAQREYYRMYAMFNAADDDSVAVDGGSAPAMKKGDRVSHVHRRGNFLDRGEVVQPGTPAFLPPLVPRGNTADRLDLARWIVDRDNPLTARVAVNHFWQHLLGRGLVASPENFGRNGERPSHPELLDWLAEEFAAVGYSRKKLIRTIVLSSTYQQASSLENPKSQIPNPKSIDPENVLLWRQNRFRVEAEIIRDSALAVSGLLDPKLGGPSIVPPYPDGLLGHRLTAEELKQPGGEHHRRSVYIFVQRTLTHPSLAAFDVADGNAACVRRERSVTPVQALALLNDPVYVECAKALGERLQKSAAGASDRLRLGFELCLTRPPHEEELTVLSELVDAQQKLGASEAAIWHGVARTLLNLEEFTTRE